MATSVVFNPTRANSGDTVTMTVTSDARVRTDTVTGATGADTFTGTFTLVSALKFTDSAGLSWSRVSDDGKTAVFTTVLA